MESSRLSDLKRFYSILGLLEKKNVEKQLLSNANGRQYWPERGVYFFFENNEIRKDSGEEMRVTRVGTHALKNDSKTSLWKRLSQHKGTAKNLGGNHRGSIFRLLVGTSLIEKGNLYFPTWGIGNNASRETKNNELILEQKVSTIIGNMPFLYLSINDEAGPESLRGYIERNCIALLSNYNKDVLDSASDKWLGHECNRERVKRSQLWNQNHVDESYDTSFLDVFEKLVHEMNSNI